MRFAWLRTTSGHARNAPMSGSERVLLVAYNVAWWVPVALPVIGLTSYTTGLVGFVVITFVRSAVNAYRVNVLPVEKGDRFPLRSP